MKKSIALLMMAALLLTVSMPAFADEVTAILPASLRTIQAEAFAGNSKLTTVFIPKTVERLGSKAFANCTGLTKVYFGNNAATQIAPDAFDGCGDIHFYVYPDTPAELFALSHGYACDVLEAGSPLLERALTMIAEHGGTSSILQSSEFATMRLITRIEGERLPDISAHHPAEIIRAGDGIYFIQFNNASDALNCCSQLEMDDRVLFVEPDACIEVFDSVDAAGTVYGRTWDTEDPMGFDVYAPFVAAHSNGRATIAVLDSGIEKRDAYLGILRSDGISLVPGDAEWSSDGQRHGSMIAGIIRDCIGNANVDVLPVRVADRDGRASQAIIALGIQYALEHGADIINMSMLFDDSEYVRYWLDQAEKANVAVVVAAGNSSRKIDKLFPANVSSVVTVSGIDNGYTLSAKSNYGNNIRYCAPDTDIVSTAYPGNRRDDTSFSAPMISAALALLKLDTYHTEEELQATCRKLTDEVNGQNNYGYGLPQLNALARIDVTDVKFDASVQTKMAVGTTQALKWNISPWNATDQNVAISSSNADVLKIEQADGKTIARAVAKGKAEIEIKANLNGLHDPVSDTVTIEVVQPVQSIAISVPKTRLAMSRTLKANVDSILPDTANDRGYEWKVDSLGGNASISQTGEITPTKVGKVRLYATANDGYGAKSNEIEIEIIDIPDEESVILSETSGKDISSGSILVKPGDTLSLAAAVKPDDADQTVSWSCESSGAVTVNQSGKVSAGSAGTGVVTATTKNGKQASLTVNVAIMPISISLSGNQTINVGATSTIQATFAPADTTDKSVTWTSGNTGIATVDQNGVVKGVSSGTVSITATSRADNAVKASISITVKQPYTLAFNANGGNVGTASKTAYSGYAVGDLPVASRDYYDFAGWYTAVSGGNPVTASTVLNSSSAYTIYAHWNIHATSDWVLASSVPAGAQVVESKTEMTESTSASVSGWTQYDSYWNQTGSGSIEYASKPDGVRGQWPDTNMSDGPLSGWDNGTTKRDVSNSWAGYVYWHWMYDTNYSNGTSQRAILDYQGTGPDTKFYYKFFGAFTSTNGNYSGDRYYCNSRSIYNYIVPERTAWNDCQGATRWFRYDYYRSYYIDYQKVYKFKRDLVRYRAK